MKAALVVLAFHSGGFFSGSPALVEPVCDIARAQGARCVAVRYPLGDLSAAVRKARRASRRHPGAVAYGESAGGVLAARLAAEGRVKAAATLASPLDIARFEHPYIPDMWDLAGASRRDRVRYGVTGTPRSPLRLYDSKEDPVVPWTFNRRFVRSTANTTRRRAYGYHASIDLEVRDRALGWLLDA